jgi:hypothetical protein
MSAIFRSARGQATAPGLLLMHEFENTHQATAEFVALPCGRALYSTSRVALKGEENPEENHNEIARHSSRERSNS